MDTETYTGLSGLFRNSSWSLQTLLQYYYYLLIDWKLTLTLTLHFLAYVSLNVALDQ